MSDRQSSRIRQLKKRCTEYKDTNIARKEYTHQVQEFCIWLLENKRCTKDEMRVFFNRRRKDE